jgi:hypothetical protein
MNDEIAANAAALRSDLDVPPSLEGIRANLALQCDALIGVLGMFSAGDIVKLGFVNRFTARDLLGDPHLLRELLLLGLRFGLIDDDCIALRFALGYEAGDPESPENRSLSERLQEIETKDAQALAWLVTAITESGYLEDLLIGPIPACISLSALDNALTRSIQSRQRRFLGELYENPPSY